VDEVTSSWWVKSRKWKLVVWEIQTSLTVKSKNLKVNNQNPQCVRNILCVCYPLEALKHTKTNRNLIILMHKNQSKDWKICQNIFSWLVHYMQPTPTNILPTEPRFWNNLLSKRYCFSIPNISFAIIKTLFLRTWLLTEVLSRLQTMLCKICWVDWKYCIHNQRHSV